MTAITGAEWRALVDTLVPGDGRFPAASAVGTHGLAAERWRDWHGEAEAEALAEALRAAGGPLHPHDPGKQVDVLRRLERDAPGLFGALRAVVYLAYYGQPEVCDAIRALGFAYNDAPLPAGYALPAFDTGAHAPQHARGSYVATDAVRRVDLAGLDFLSRDEP